MTTLSKNLEWYAVPRDPLKGLKAGKNERGRVGQGVSVALKPEHLFIQQQLRAKDSPKL